MSKLTEQIRAKKVPYGLGNTYVGKYVNDAREEDAKLVEERVKQLVEKLKDAHSYNDWSLVDEVVAELGEEKK